MIKKTENCLYCGEKMESKTAKKKFCSALHRVYWNREKEKGTLGLEIVIKNNKPELVKYNRESVLPVANVSRETIKHKLWKQGDPMEGSNAFYLRYGVRYYDEIEK